METTPPSPHTSFSATDILSGLKVVLPSALVSSCLCVFLALSAQASRPPPHPLPSSPFIYQNLGSVIYHPFLQIKVMQPFSQKLLHQLCFLLWNQRQPLSSASRKQRVTHKPSVSLCCMDRHFLSQPEAERGLTALLTICRVLCGQEFALQKFLQAGSQFPLGLQGEPRVYLGFLCDKDSLLDQTSLRFL